MGRLSRTSASLVVACLLLSLPATFSPAHSLEQEQQLETLETLLERAKEEYRRLNQDLNSLKGKVSLSQENSSQLLQRIDELERLRDEQASSIQSLESELASSEQRLNASVETERRLRKRLSEALDELRRARNSLSELSERFDEYASRMKIRIVGAAAGGAAAGLVVGIVIMLVGPQN